MKTITVETTVGELVRAVPGRSRIFENLGIDYCCGGKTPLEQACRTKGLDPETVVAMLTGVEAAPEGSPSNPETMALGVLCEHIERAHHDYLRAELPRLDFMTRKVAAVHGDHEPRLHDLRRAFEAFQSEISSHTRQEEERVFPAIRRLESSNGDDGTPTANLRTALADLESEHERAGSALERFRELTDGFQPPEWACNTFRAMYDALLNLERDMHEHVHKENNVLFPRALAARGAA